MTWRSPRALAFARAATQAIVIGWQTPSVTPATAMTTNISGSSRNGRTITDTAATTRLPIISRSRPIRAISRPSSKRDAIDAPARTASSAPTVATLRPRS